MVPGDQERRPVAQPLPLHDLEDPADRAVRRADGTARARVGAAALSAIGAFRDVVLGYWDPEKKEYERVPVNEQVEVVALLGNIALAPDASPKVHAHVVVAKRDGTAHGGHLLEAHVRPTLEVVVIEEPEHLQRRRDASTGLPLIVPGEE